MGKQTRHFYEFGAFRIDVANRSLLRNEEVISLAPKAFDVLLVLAQNPGRLLERDELMRILWPDTIVQEDNLTQTIFVLRKALGESPSGPKYIETIPKRGYRFVPEVSALSGDEADSGLPTSSRPAREDMENESESASPGERGDRAPSSAPVPHSDRGRKSSRFAFMVSAFLGLVVIALVYFGMANRYRPAHAGLAVRSIAVLPFKPLVIGGGDEYLELGMADALITRLSNLRQIIVRPTSAVLKYTGPGQDLVSIGRELAVDALLDGKIQRSGDRIRVTVQLVRARDGAPLWAEAFDVQFTSIFAVQDSISRQVTQALMLKLTGEEKRQLAKRYTENTEAYQLYVMGRYYRNKAGSGWRDKGIECFTRAIKLDPAYALAYAGLADFYVLRSDSVPPRATALKAKEVALKALELDDQLAEAHTALAVVKFSYDWDWAGAENAFQRALALNPGYADAHYYHARYLMAMGRAEESLIEIKQALALAPASIRINMNMAWLYYMARQYDQAIEQFRKTLDMDPNFRTAHLRLGQTYLQKGMFPEAIAEIQKRETGPESSGGLVALAYAYAISGHKDKALTLLDDLKERMKQRYIGAFGIAIIYVGLGDSDQALEWLQKAYEDRSPLMITLKVEPRFDSLRADPRFADLLRRVGLPP
jgi:DNA-binding winged helix-turn-helix (wHTH) protein/TolB-like protein/Tfp pilus assembly protein PilF